MHTWSDFNFINEGAELPTLRMSLKRTDPDLVYRLVKKVVMDYFHNDVNSSQKDISIDAKYSAYYQQDKDWKCWLTVTFGHSVEKKDVTELKKLIKDEIK